MQCNKCGSDNTQRLEVIYEHGTSNISSTSYTAGGGYGGMLGVGGATTTTNGIQQTTMGQKAAPPTKKAYKWAIGGAIIGMLLVENSLVLGGAIIAVSAYFIHRTYQYNNHEWQELYQYWQECWLCNKCGNIYHQPPDR